MKYLYLTVFSLLAMAITGCAKADAGEEKSNKNEITAMTNNSSANEKGTKVLVKTTLGDFTVLLYNDTPLHRDNFVKLVKEGYYDGVLFHRVINEFMVQAGDPDSHNAPQGKMLGSGGPDYTIAAEIVYPTHYHKRGALAAARQGDQVNPERRSSGSQFYIVTGKKFSSAEMDALENNLLNKRKQATFNQLAMQHRDEIMKLQREQNVTAINALRDSLIAQTEQLTAGETGKMPQAMREAYTNQGGSPHLDGDYTVFGEVVSGMDVIDKIEKVQTDRNDRPVDDVRILSMKIVD